jgi:hypothetical protein
MVKYFILTWETAAFEGGSLIVQKQQGRHLVVVRNDHQKLV